MSLVTPLRVSSNAEPIPTHQTFHAVRTCDEDIPEEKVLDEVERVRDQ